MKVISLHCQTLYEHEGVQKTDLNVGLFQSNFYVK